jgi:transcriptional regulator with XRE-family HTH domain
VTDEVKSPSEAAAEELRRVRTRKGWNQQQLADRLHELGAPIDRATISKIETGDRRVTLDEVFWFAYALGVSPAALMLPRPYGSTVAVTPTTSLPSSRALDWLRGFFFASESDQKDETPTFFFEERIEEDALAWQYYPELSKLRDEAAVAVRFAMSGDGSGLRVLLGFIQEEAADALRKLALSEKQATPSEPANSKDQKREETG